MGSVDVVRVGCPDQADFSVPGLHRVCVSDYVVQSDAIGAQREFI